MAGKGKQEEYQSRMAAREARILELDEELQRIMNAPYLVRNDVTKMRFVAGDPVLSMSHGLWYDAIVEDYVGTTTPTSMTEALEKVSDYSVCVVPVCTIRFPGWSKRFNEPVPENELVSRDLHEVVYENTFGLLVAHEWNECRRAKLGLSSRSMGAGAFFMEESDYKYVENLWQQFTGSNQSFAAYAGRDAER